MINFDINATYMITHDCCKKFIENFNLDEHEYLDITVVINHNKILENYNLIITITQCKNHDNKHCYTYNLQSRPKVYGLKLRKVSTYEVRGLVQE